MSPRTVSRGGFLVPSDLAASLLNTRSIVVPVAKQDYHVARVYEFCEGTQVAISLDDYDGAWHADFRNFTPDGRPTYVVSTALSGTTIGEWVLLEELSFIKPVDGIPTWVPYFLKGEVYVVDQHRRLAYLKFLQGVRERWLGA